MMIVDYASRYMLGPSRVQALAEAPVACPFGVLNGAQTPEYHPDAPLVPGSAG